MTHKQPIITSAVEIQGEREGSKVDNSCVSGHVRGAIESDEEGRHHDSDLHDEGCFFD